MGYGLEESRRGLRLSGGDVTAAVDFILEQRQAEAVGAGCTCEQAPQLGTLAEELGTNLGPCSQLRGGQEDFSPVS